MRKAIYAGSFDPVTLGHLDIIKRGAALVDNLVVAVLENPNKTCLFSIDERKEHLKLVTRGIENVEIASFSGLLADFASEIGAGIAIRGLRTAIDFESEFQMHLINRELNSGIETILLAADEKHVYLSSSAVKQVAIFGGRIDFMVPAEIEGFIREKYTKRGDNNNG